MLTTLVLAVSGQLGRLESLQLAGNQLVAWEDINRLDAYPALLNLRLTGNPCLMGQDVVTSRLEVSAWFAPLWPPLNASFSGYRRLHAQ